MPNHEVEEFRERYPQMWRAGLMFLLVNHEALQRLSAAQGAVGLAGHLRSNVSGEFSAFTRNVFQTPRNAEPVNGPLRELALGRRVARVFSNAGLAVPLGKGKFHLRSEKLPAVRALLARH